jgi:hypothetical protein
MHVMLSQLWPPLQASPHALQLLEFDGVSQPVDGIKSQSKYPELHTPIVQTPPLQVLVACAGVVQSLTERHPLPMAHGAHELPPQSVSVSVPFFAPSEHVGA